MNYLYGDSTPSQLRSNFLEFLRDAIDFSVFVLEADYHIKQGHRKIGVLREEAEAETAQLDRFVASVTKAVEAGEKGPSDSATARCATRIEGLVADAHRSAVASIQQNLENEVARVGAEETSSREGCLGALATLLAPHEPPDASTVTQVVLNANGRYEATLTGSAQFGLDWTFELGFPESSLWMAPLRMERLFPHLEIRAPQLTGWITKEVKIRPQKLERHVVTELVDDGFTLAVNLRAEIGSDAGFDLAIAYDEKRVTALKRGPNDDTSVGDFDVQPEDLPALLDLADKLRATTADFTRDTLVAARFGDADFHAQPTFVAFVERFVAMMAPIVREIGDRSLTQNELVLRRALGNDRREEIFVAKSTLREKYATLAQALRALFVPLGLDPVDRPRPTPSKPMPSEPAVRAELPKSQPPPPPAAQSRVATMPPKIPPPPRTPESLEAVPAPTRSDPSVEVVMTPEPMPAAAPVAPPVESAPPAPAPVTAPPKAVSVSAAPKAVSAAPIGPLPPPAVPPVPDSNPMLTRNEALVTSLKKILTLSKNGRIEDAYREYQNLFSSPAFADYRPDDQRQALKLMVLTKASPPPSDAFRDAHRAAIARLHALVEALNEPGDLEMLGVAQVVVGDEKAALTAFEKALALERARNPASELVGNLMRRVSQL